ncbi:GNAT family N-acetyltransferase [Roseibium sp. RKSG952]|uniref:GNAT family N-acetyltransferase n=1 Tax=Roseibium sp. RKSG952 TaxID=2529384 RepID=UPI0012BBEEC0|nr:N-acetyltransferase [Roseibium sp. RKSG952]MTH97065.1 N-acetyltransferase [Roseibium sp. RKSG952]
MNRPENGAEFEIRHFAATDAASVPEVISEAFGQETEAHLVHTLRHCGALVLELVAVNPAGRVIGHIAFSRVTAAAVGPGAALSIVCLAPVSVLPDLQKSGIGSALIRKGIEELKATGEDLILVLGAPAYYNRFGFDSMLARKVNGPYAGDPFMALALTEAGSRDLPVDVAFATPFQEFE